MTVGMAMWVGLLVYVALIAGIVRYIPRRNPDFAWRPVYRWSLFIPQIGIAIWAVNRLRGERTIARTCLELAALCWACWWAFSLIFEYGVSRPNQIKSLLDAARQHPATSRLERLIDTRPYQHLTPDDMQQVNDEWNSAERTYYETAIRRDDTGMTLEAARANSGYPKMWPSQRAAFDAAWQSINPRRRVSQR